MLNILILLLVGYALYRLFESFWPVILLLVFGLGSLLWNEGVFTVLLVLVGCYVLYRAYRSVVFGILLIASLGLLWWNEADFVHKRDAVKEAARAVEELVDLGHVRQEVDGHLVHATGEALANGQVRDRDLGLALRVLSLKRKVHYYQWVEKKHTKTPNPSQGGEKERTTYQYVGEWVDSPVSSKTFADPDARTRYANSIRLALKDTEVFAKTAMLGAYRLPTVLLEELPTSPLQNLRLAQAERHALAARMHADPAFIHVQDNCVYLGHNPNLPEIGDMRVFFYAAHEGTISILARAKGGSFEPYQAANGKKIFAAKYGAHSAYELYAAEEPSNALGTWLIRFFGLILVSVALGFLLEPLNFLASFVPFLDEYVEEKRVFVCLCVGPALSFAVMAIAWITYRPLIGIALLALGLLFAVLLPLRKKLLSQKAQAHSRPHLESPCSKS